MTKFVFVTGGVLSSLQTAPLILITVSAWKFRNMPGAALTQLRRWRSRRRPPVFFGKHLHPG